MTDNEKKAIQLSKDRKRLLQRLLDAKACLHRPIQTRLSPWKFSLQAKRLTSKDGKYALQWQTRANPEEPISYKNQQASVGTVLLIRC